MPNIHHHHTRRVKAKRIRIKGWNRFEKGERTHLKPPPGWNRFGKSLKHHRLHPKGWNRFLK